jgi:ATP-dependent DNA helicase RecQ
MTIFEALKKYFGYETFRPGQQEIIEAILNGENVLAVLPTGAGKSLCYQIPALVSDGFSIVISPLIALMKDQVDSLTKSGIAAAFINSTISYTETEIVLNEIAFGKIKLLYVAPERVEGINFSGRLKQLKPVFLFVDEAHCISEWGHNFRPSYSKIKSFVDFAGIKRISAFTATATPEVENDIVKQLGLKDPKVFVKGFERENLYLNVLQPKRKKEKCLELLSKHTTPAIIYTSSRKRAEEVSEFLNMNRVSCTYYHAGLLAVQRKKIQEDFINDKIPVIAATNAFGMGIDKKDIRLVIHYNTPGSVENYYQEIGRAGRDGEPASIFLLHDDSDINIQNYFLSSSHPDKLLIQKIYDAICDYSQTAVNSQPDKQLPVNIDYISSYINKNISRGLLYAALQILEAAGYIKNLSALDQRTSFRFLLAKDKLKQFVKSTSNLNFKEIVLQLLRMYGSEILRTKTTIRLAEISHASGMPEAEADEALSELDNIGVAEYEKILSGENVKLLIPRIPSDRLIIDFDKLNRSYLNLQRKIETMVEYVYSDRCRFAFILDYFGENTTDFKCGRCDNCSNPNIIPDSSRQYIKEILLRTVNESPVPLTLNKTVSILTGNTKLENLKELDTFGTCANYSKTDIHSVLDELISIGLLERNKASKNRLQLTLKGIEYLDEHNLFFETVIEENNYEKNLELFNLLREVRQNAAKKFMQTGYLICPDSILKEIAGKKPKNKWEMMSIKGFNNRMYNKIGHDFLEVIRQFKADSVAAAEKPKSVPSNILETYKLLKKGYSLKDIASIRRLSEAVISMQIESIIEFMPETDISNLFEHKLLKITLDEIKKGYIDLKDLKQRLPAEVSYPLIRIAAVKYKLTSPESRRLSGRDRSDSLPSSKLLHDE